MPKIKPLIILLWSLLVLFLILLVWVMATLSPDSTVNILLFYVSMFVASFCGFTLIGFYLRKSWGAREWVSRHLGLATRQGLWFALLLAVSMFLLSRGWFTWFNAGSLFLALVFLESYLITKSNDREP